MIENNLGFWERAVRLILGIVLGGWIIVNPPFGWLDWVGLVAALFLLLNAFFGRCYLWKMLGISTKEGCGEDGLEEC